MADIDGGGQVRGALSKNSVTLLDGKHCYIVGWKTLLHCWMENTVTLLDATSQTNLMFARNRILPKLGVKQERDNSNAWQER